MKRIVEKLAIAVAMSMSLTACGGQKSEGRDAKAPAKQEQAQANKQEQTEGKKGEKAEGKKSEGLSLTPEERSRSGIEVQTLQAGTAADVVSVTATIRPSQDRWARVAPRVEGRILKVMANLGDRVTVGQPLVALDSVALGEAQSGLRQAETAQRVARADYERISGLAKEEIVSQKELLRARAELEKANAEAAAARDKMRLLGAGGATGGDAGFTLRSPLNGTVIERKAAVGELATPDEALFTVADLSRLWIEANLTEDMLSKVRVGANADVMVAAYPGVRFHGRVTYVSQVMNKESRAIPARIEVPNSDGRLKPEMFATAEIATGAAKSDVLTVPDAAVLLMQGQPTVFVETANGFETRPVETGERLAGRIVVKSGLQPGDKAVTAGAYALKARVLKSQISEE